MLKKEEKAEEDVAFEGEIDRKVETIKQFRSLAKK